MALTAGVLPSVFQSRVRPYDAQTAFARAQTLAATGSVNNVNTQIDVGPGRVCGYWCLDPSNMKFSATDEFYRFFLLGSNDIAFGNGNVDKIAGHDFAALAANRLVPVICAASPAVPLLGLSSTPHTIPYCNFMGGFIFRYLQCYVIIGGTAPTVTLASWLTYDTDN